MLRKTFASLAIACCFASSASAALLGSATLSRNPTGNPAVLFATDTGLNTAPNDGWISYILSVSTDVGVITGVDANISGTMLQRWNITEGDEGPVVSPTPSITGTTNGDSHLLLSANALVGAAPTENNNVNTPGAPSIPADTATRDYGIGNSLTGAWGIPGAEQSASVQFGYIVVPKSAWSNNTITGLNLTIQVGLPGGAFDTITTSAFSFPNPGGGTAGVAPVVPDFSASATLNQVIATTITKTAGDEPITWGNLTNFVYTPGFGAKPNPTGIGQQPTWNPATQQFSFNTAGSTRGTYSWDVTATNASGADTFKISVDVPFVPEPTTMTLFGLAIAGVVGFARRRS